MNPPIYSTTGAVDSTSTKRPRQAMIDQATTLIFDQDIGFRMSVIRMMLMKDQREMAAYFGISQQAYSRLETGRTTTTDKINMARFKAVFGDHASYIVYGANSVKYNQALIRRTFWETRLFRKKFRVAK